MQDTETIFLGSAVLDATLIDKAIQAGLRGSDFQNPHAKACWDSLLSLRTEGQDVDDNALFLSFKDKADPDLKSFALSLGDAVATSIHGNKALKALVERAALRKTELLMSEAKGQIEKGKHEDVKQTVNRMAEVLAHAAPQEHTLADTIESAIRWTAEQCNGTASDEKVVLTGLPNFDRHASPIQMHEYVVVGARTSTGKSSLMTQIARVNLERGLRVAMFTLETSCRAICLQMASQISAVNLRDLHGELPEKLDRFHAYLAALKTKPLMLFENDLSLEAIEARCRLLATSWKPDLVIIDYLGLIRVRSDGAYERMSKLSKAMIPLRKSLGCCLMVAAQLNRGNEMQDRRPTRTDFRDAGSIEEDAHRILALHRPSKDSNGLLQELGQSTFEQEIFQLKLRDGPLAEGKLRFYAKHTTFHEV